VTTMKVMNKERTTTPDRSSRSTTQTHIPSVFNKVFFESVGDGFWFWLGEVLLAAAADMALDGGGGP
jgi:hypothetical protein